MKTTWRHLISAALAGAHESWGDVVATTLDDAGLDRKFDSGFGGPEGLPFTLWTTARVYFPVQYDGAESVASAPRNPCSEAMDHVGT